MPTPREVLKLLPRDELVSLAQRFGVELTDRRNKARILAAITALPRERIRELLLTLSREELQNLCRQLKLDQGGRDKAILVARLLPGPVVSEAAEPPPSPPAEVEPSAEQEARGEWAAPSKQMWRRIQLKNYRSIAEASVELAPFTVLVGPNGGGKSNLADAFAFTRDIAVDAEKAVERRGGVVGLRRWQPTEVVDLSIDIRAATTRAGLDSDYLRHQFTLRSEGSGSWSFQSEVIELVSGGEAVRKIKRAADGTLTHEKPSLAALGDSKVDEMSSAMVFARQLADMARQTALRNVTRLRLDLGSMRLPQLRGESTRLDESGSNIAMAFNSLDPLGKERVLLGMQRIVPGLVRISVEPLDRFLLMLFEQKQPRGQVARFAASEISEGALRALGMLVAAQQMTQDELLIIEEPESSIHAGAVRFLFDVLKDASSRGAVLITTHSAELLEAAREEEILVCSYREGVTRIGPLSSKQREGVRQGLFSLAELMRSEPLRMEGEEPAAAQL
jgi:type I restriction enzyme M protein